MFFQLACHLLINNSHTSLVITNVVILKIGNKNPYKYS